MDKKNLTTNVTSAKVSAQSLCVSMVEGEVLGI